MKPKMSLIKNILAICLVFFSFSSFAETSEKIFCTFDDGRTVEFFLKSIPPYTTKDESGGITIVGQTLTENELIYQASRRDGSYGVEEIVYTKIVVSRMNGKAIMTGIHSISSNRGVTDKDIPPIGGSCKKSSDIKKQF